MEIITTEHQAFVQPIKEGNARILIKLQSIECEVDNSAPDFVTVEDDELFLKVQPSPDVNLKVPGLERTFPIRFKRYLPDGSGLLLELEQPGIWFDILIDEVKDIWIADLVFTIESKHERYLNYYINKLDHRLEWLQPDIRTGEIKSMSVSTKKFKPPRISGKESFSAQEVIRCADMIGRAVRKIDIRTSGAYVKFNTDKGRLEPLIIGIAEKLGYTIEPLDKGDILSMENDGLNVSHAIYLKRF